MITLPFNIGIGGAVQTGFKYALERGYPMAVRLDGDGQHVPRTPKLLEALGRVGGHRHRLPLHRGADRIVRRSHDASASSGLRSSYRC